MRFVSSSSICRDPVVLPAAFEGLDGLAAVAAVWTTSTAPPGSSAPQPRTATASPRTRSTPDCTQPSSNPHEPAEAPTRGTPPSAGAAALSFDDAIAYALDDSRTDTHDSTSTPPNSG